MSGRRDYIFLRVAVKPEVTELRGQQGSTRCHGGSNSKMMRVGLNKVSFWSITSTIPHLEPSNNKYRIDVHPRIWVTFVSLNMSHFFRPYKGLKKYDIFNSTNMTHIRGCTSILSNTWPTASRNTADVSPWNNPPFGLKLVDICLFLL